MTDVKVINMLGRAIQLSFITPEGMLNIPGARNCIKEAEADIKALVDNLKENIGLEVTKIKLTQGKVGYEVTISMEI